MSHRQIERPGQPPGMFADGPATRIDVMAYGADAVLEEAGVTLERVAELARSSQVVWVDVVGVADGATLSGLGQIFGLHALVLEDVAHVEQRPKFEEYEDYNFIVMRMVYPGIWPGTEQLAIVQKTSCVVTFRERSSAGLEQVRERIRRNKGRIRRAGADYLTYTVLDAVMDNYAPLLDWYDERIEAVERSILCGARPTALSDIYEMKHEILALRRVLLPQRDAIGQIHLEEVPLFSPETEVYVRDCYDHALRLLEGVELLRERAGVLMDLYLSNMTRRMNEVMKVLTIIATIFIPLSFIASVYGMNFSPEASAWNMPELHWRYGYIFALGIMATLSLGLLFYFYRKGWLRSEEKVALPERAELPAPRRRERPDK